MTIPFSIINHPAAPSQPTEQVERLLRKELEAQSSKLEVGKGRLKATTFVRPRAQDGGQASWSDEETIG